MQNHWVGCSPLVVGVVIGRLGLELTWLGNLTCYKGVPGHLYIDVIVSGDGGVSRASSPSIVC